MAPAAELDEDRPHVVTHGERRGAALRQQADARWAVQAESGDALSLAAYTGSPMHHLAFQQVAVQHTCYTHAAVTEANVIA